MLVRTSTWSLDVVQGVEKIHLQPLPSTAALSLVGFPHFTNLASKYKLDSTKSMWSTRLFSYKNPLPHIVFNSDEDFLERSDNILERCALRCLPMCTFCKLKDLPQINFSSTFCLSLVNCRKTSTC